MGIIPKNKGTRIIIVIMFVLALIGLTIAWVYYSGINNSADPRVRDARTLYGRYNKYAVSNDQEKILALLDSIQKIYQSVDHYQNSYEIGVVMNNRATIYLSRAISDTLVEEIREQYFAMAEQALLEGIGFYDHWMGVYGQLEEPDIKQLVHNDFMSDPSIASDKRAEAYIQQRTNDIITARSEMPRRLSVSYTNLGIIKRHENLPEEAAAHYSKALDLWDENLAAKNNLNILFGRPLEKQGILRKLFPPKKDNNPTKNPTKIND